MVFGGRANVSEVFPDHPLAGRSIFFGQKLLDRSKPPSSEADVPVKMPDLQTQRGDADE